MSRIHFSRRHLTPLALVLALSAAPWAAKAARHGPAPLSDADHALVDRAGDYLQGLTEAKARFTQTDARGNVSQGTLYLHRPGKARFAYDPPSGLLVVADGHAVSIVNSQLRTFDRYPLWTTPLSIFLAKQVRLDRGVSITAVSKMADGFSITARDGRKVAEGEISLTFTDSPMALVGWSVVDAQGNATRIRLADLDRSSGLSPSLFVLNDPHPRKAKRPQE